MKKRILLITIFIILQNNNLRSEDCILNSGSANDINKYNQCLANKMQMANNQNSIELEYLRNEIIKLKEENLILRQKLDQIKDMLKNIFLNI
tara:strand:- start:257 stop:532 length:276 start_codon:yes stop_codon:yes gene_type:complete